MIVFLSMMWDDLKSLYNSHFHRFWSFFVFFVLFSKSNTFSFVFLTEFPFIFVKSVIDILVYLSSNVVLFFSGFVSSFWRPLHAVKPLVDHKLDIANCSIIVKRPSWQTHDHVGVVLCIIQRSGFWKWFWTFFYRRITQLADRSEQKSHAWQIRAPKAVQLWLCNRIRSSNQPKWWKTWILHFSSSCFPSWSIRSCWLSNSWIINAQEVTFDPWALFSLGLTRRNAGAGRKTQSRIRRHSTLYGCEPLRCKDGAKGDAGTLKCFWNRSRSTLPSLDRRGDFLKLRLWKKTSFEPKSSIRKWTAAVLGSPQKFLRLAANTAVLSFHLRFGWRVNILALVSVWSPTLWFSWWK